MNKKVIGILVSMLLITTAIPIVGGTEENKNATIDEGSICTVSNYNGDFLDQYQNSTCNTGWNIHSNQWMAQSFTPTLKILTRVQLYLFKGGNPPENTIIVFSIREELTGIDLTAITLTNDELPQTNRGVWIEFDFKDIHVNPNNLYYMMCRSNVGGGMNCFVWLFNYPNPYKSGDSWSSFDQGQTWFFSGNQQFSDTDCCFRTYGYNNIPPNTPTMTGVINGDIKTPYDYTIQTTDPNQDNVKYQIDWGDNTTTITGMNESGIQVIVSHIWNTKGTYNVKVKAIDEYNAESDWATLTVTMPCSYKPLPQILDRFFHRFPHAFPLLQQLMGY